MSDTIERLVRLAMCGALKRPDDQAPQVDLHQDLKFDYGLASLDLIVLMSTLCQQAEVDMTLLDENDIARLNTPADIVALLGAKATARGEA